MRQRTRLPPPQEGSGAVSFDFILRACVADEISAGRLVRVLPRWEIEATDLYLAYPSARLLRPVVRAFIVAAVPALRRVDGIVRHATPFFRVRPIVEYEPLAFCASIPKVQRMCAETFRE